MAPRGHFIPDRARRNSQNERGGGGGGQQTDITRAYNKALTTSYRALNPVVYLGNEVGIPLNSPFNQNLSSYGKDWSKFKEETQLDTAIYFIWSLKNVVQETLTSTGAHFKCYLQRTFFPFQNKCTVRFFLWMLLP